MFPLIGLKNSNDNSFGKMKYAKITSGLKGKSKDKVIDVYIRILN